MQGLRPESVLEVGCNVGGNLMWIAPEVGAENCHGIDINEKALAILAETIPGVHEPLAAARELPFEDAVDRLRVHPRRVDPPAGRALGDDDEMVRVAKRWVLCGEYFGEQTTEVAYRGHEGALLPRLRRSLRRARSATRAPGLLGRDEGWDDITWWLFERI